MARLETPRLSLLRARLARDGYGWWPIEVKDGAPFAGVIVLREIPFEQHFTPEMEVEAGHPLRRHVLYRLQAAAGDG